jgi:hypothetical protein
MKVAIRSFLVAFKPVEVSCIPWIARENQGDRLAIRTLTVLKPVPTPLSENQVNGRKEKIC